MSPARPRIAQIVTRMDVGGVPDHVLTLIGELRHDHNITLVTGEVDAYNAAALDALGIEVIRLPAFRRLPDPTRDAKLVMALARLMRERRFDLVHTHMSKAALAGAVAARLVRPRPRLVNTAHILGSIALSNPMMRRLFGVYDRLLLGGATDAVIVVSEAIRERAIGLGVIPPARLHAVQNGILTDRFAVGPAEAAARRAEFGAGREDTLAVTVARLVPWKGIDLLIDALAILAPRRPQLRAVVVGDGPLRAELEGRAAARGMARQLIFAGVRRDVPEILSAADIFVLPSVAEGMPIAVLEAMSAGLPVVATAVDGVPEVVLEDEVGLLVRTRDPAEFAGRLDALVVDPEKRRRLGASARRRVETAFSARRMAENTAEVYRTLLRTGSSGVQRAAGRAA
jgi:glycosyltransferase involved in cell wall biosynthesis